MTKIPDDSSLPLHYQWIISLPPGMKLEIISALQKSLTDENDMKSEFIKPSDFAGIWEGDESAEELIEMIQSSRYRDPDRKIEEI